jgi:hypothetical protein
MAFTSLNGGALFGTVYPNIRSAVFSNPTTLGQIAISSIAGNFTSYKITRNGGAESASQTAATYTDTSLANNTQYTYTIVPYIGGVRGKIFTAITNPNAATPGQIYTLASPSSLSLTYSGANSTTTSVYFTWTNNGYSSIRLQNTTIGGTVATYTSASATVLYNSSGKDTLPTVNGSYTYTATVVNGDGYYINGAPCQATIATCTWATAPTLTYNGAGCSASQISFTFSGGAYSNLSVQYPSGTEITKTTTSPYTGGAFSANQQVTYYVYPINALSYISSNGSNVVVCTWATAPTLTYNGAGCSTSQISFTFSGGAYTNLSVQYPSGTEITKTTTSPYTGGAFSANQQVTYYVYPINSLSYISSNGSNVAVCTWGSVNAPTFSSTTGAGTTLACTGTFSKVYITYTGAGSPASGTTVTGTNSISQSYTGVTSGTYTFNCYAVNALNYQSTTAASNSVIIPSAIVSPSAPTLGYTLSTADSYWFTGQGASCCSSNGVYAYFFSWNNNTLTNCTYTANSGTSWTKVSVTPFASWYSSISSCCCSDSGQYVYVGGANVIAVSTNYGASWTMVSGTPSGLQCVTCSSTGTTLFASVYNAANGVRASTNAYSSPASATWTTAYTGNLGQVLGMRINPNGTIMYQYRINYTGATTWNIGKQTVSGTTVGAPTIVNATGQINTAADSSAYNSTSNVHAISADGTSYAVGVYRTTGVSHQGFIWTTNSGATCTVYADTGVQHVAMKGDGSVWIAVGASGIKYSSTKFTGTALTQGPSTVLNLVQVVVASNANRYYTCTTKGIYYGTYY